jgi:RimJ/RimL family protein N-acetyltransferase
VAEWWGELPSLSDLETEYGPSIGGDERHQCHFALRNGVPIGFIQSYVPAEFHEEGWWLDVNDPSVRGIDQFLADANLLGRGLGTEMVADFVARLFADPTVTLIQTDPDPANARAIRCYEKAGFHAVREIETPDGRALLMHNDRPR